MINHKCPETGCLLCMVCDLYQTLDEWKQCNIKLAIENLHLKKVNEKMDAKIKKIEKVNSKAGKELKELERMDKKQDKVVAKAKMKMKGKC